MGTAMLLVLWVITLGIAGDLGWTQGRRRGRAEHAPATAAPVEPHQVEALAEVLTSARAMIGELHTAASEAERVIAAERVTREIRPLAQPAASAAAPAAEVDDDEDERTKITAKPSGRALLKLLITQEEHDVLEALGRLEVALGGAVAQDAVANISHVRRIGRMGAERSRAERIAILDRITAEVIDGSLVLPDMRALSAELVSRLLGSPVDASDPDARAAVHPGAA